jgi:hypothetical protein
MFPRLVVFALLACALAGCASLTPEDAQRDRVLKQFGTKPDIARLYVYCDEWLGVVQKFNVALDGRPLGQLASLTYLHAEVAPGRHRITATASNTDTLEFEAEAGHNYYVWHEAKLGMLYPGVRLHLMPESEGKVATAGTRFVPPTYREEDMQMLKARAIVGMFFGQILGALPAASGGSPALIGAFAP